MERCRGLSSPARLRAAGSLAVLLLAGGVLAQPAGAQTFFTYLGELEADPPCALPPGFDGSEPIPPQVLSPNLVSEFYLCATLQPATTSSGGTEVCDSDAMGEAVADGTEMCAVKAAFRGDDPLMQGATIEVVEFAPEAPEFIANVDESGAILSGQTLRVFGGHPIGGAVIEVLGVIKLRGTADGGMFLRVPGESSYVDARADTQPAPCMDQECVLASVASLCGNGDPANPFDNLDPGETCDDGNLISGDGCSSTCLAESSFSLVGVAAGVGGSAGSLSFGLTDGTTTQVFDIPLPSGLTAAEAVEQAVAQVNTFFGAGSAVQSISPCQTASPPAPCSGSFHDAGLFVVQGTSGPMSGPAPGTGEQVSTVLDFDPENPPEVDDDALFAPEPGQLTLLAAGLALLAGLGALRHRRR